MLSGRDEWRRKSPFISAVHRHSIRPVTGWHDWITPVQDATQIAQEMLNAGLLVFEDSGHFPFVEEPVRFQIVLRDFVNRL